MMAIPAAYFDGAGDSNRLDQPADHGHPVQSNAAGTALVVNGAEYQIKPGYRTVLFGDSMTETQYSMGTATASYNKNTGVMTVTASGHQFATGWYCKLFNRNYSSLLAGRRLQVTRLDANTFTVQVESQLADLPDGALTGTTQYRPEHWQSAQGFVAWLQIASGWRFNIVNNGAQSGDTTANALARLDAEVLAYNPQVVIMQLPGINDLSTGNGPVDENTIYANLTQIIDKISAAAYATIVLTITPVAASEAAGRANLQAMQKVMRINRRVKDYCLAVPGVIVFDAWGKVVDPTNTTGLAKAEYLRTAPDAIHYSMRGGKMIADALWGQIQHQFSSVPDTLPKCAADSYNGSKFALTSPTRSGNVITATATAHGCNTGEVLKATGGTSEVLNDWVVVTRVDANTLTFPSVGTDGAISGTVYLGRNNNLFDKPILQTATGGTVVAPGTGVAADNLRIQGVVGSPAYACSVVARDDGYGNDQMVAITAAASGNQVKIGLDYDQYFTELPAITKAGRKYVAEASVSMTGVLGSNLSEIRFNLEATVSGVSYQVYALNGYADGPVLNADWSGHLRTPEFVLPSGTSTLINAALTCSFSASGTELAVKIGRISLREIEGS